MKQLKKYKHFLMRLLNLVLIVGVCFAYHNIATIRAEKEAKIAAENSGVHGRTELMKAAVRDLEVRSL